ncbi:MAG TPA: GNAT family protein [Solirubrobacteraceae bacterium]|nr:GNAT family protein [Solirubrobacteraceae bacterium]
MAPPPRALAFQPVGAGDGALLAAIFGDVRVAAWLRPAGGEGPFTATECERMAAAGAARWTAHGFGPWLVSEAGSPVAHGGLAVKVIDGRAEVEVAWAVAAEHWRRGIASAIGARALALARELELRRVVAIARVDNAASRAVVGRLAMREEGRIMHAGLEHVFALAPDGGAACARAPQGGN